MCFSYVQVERRRAVGGVETVESNKMDVWNVKCSRVFIHGSAFSWIASAEYLGIYYLWLIELISLNWNMVKYCVLLDLQ